MLLDGKRLPPLTADGRLTQPLSQPRLVATEATHTLISTGLCDLQVNGFAGVDYNNPDLTAEAFERSLAVMLAGGVTRCLPTLISDSEDRQAACLRALEASRAASPLATEMVVGYHLEGPFLSPLAGFRGCHPAAAMVPASWAHFQRLQDAAGGRIRLLTVAPEVEGVLALIPRWVEHGVVVAIGHSAASRQTLLQAVDAGASLSTHLGNGTAAQLAKSDNPILNQLADDRLNASFIADGYHLQPHLLGVYLRVKPSPRTLLVTDATAGAAAPAGSYTLGPVALQRQADAVVTLPQTNSLAGSAATLAGCVGNVINWYDTPPGEALAWASENPRRVIGLSDVPQPGDAAEWVWWQKSAHDNELRATQVQLGAQRFYY